MTGKYVLKMSDEDRDVDIESDEDDDGTGQYMTQAEKRAHHNALERKRRDHIKESFHNLRDSIPTLPGEKVGGSQNHVEDAARMNSKASRAQILKQATEYIQFMSKKNGSISQDIDDLKRQNSILDQQVRALERAKRAGTFAGSLNHVDIENTAVSDFKQEDTDSDDTSDLELEQQHRPKKLKT